VDDLCRCGLGSSRDAGGEGKNGEHDEETHLLRWGTAFASSEKKVKVSEKKFKNFLSKFGFPQLFFYFFFIYLFFF
jgi:hypothetical protein